MFDASKFALRVSATFLKDWQERGEIGVFGVVYTNSYINVYIHTLECI